MARNEQYNFKIIEAILVSNNGIQSGEIMAVLNCKRAWARKLFTNYKREYNPDLFYDKSLKRWRCLADYKPKLITRRDAINIMKVATFLHKEG